MESHAAPAHLVTMSQSLHQRISDEPLGEPAPDRGPVDLLVEAMRLKFTEAEISELKRLYAVNDQPGQGKTPQNPS